ncbi:hypothetical protein ASPZODRAFT_163462 [Penicilliopsis zonata CBS 506.65]|uniref:Uncharacterized protein n=1 Tax=Penicilliopsis zonata CBS 506.65 TaxID=1073090 RepID=A0A1L9SWT2_9EURO|nr:hypothetical protein ASPZODRAFT_163462 [Penicilliopsis zonata CBS 506.65]OJJ51655.1 hypothetical protein ASPZODRAFT_163462 [Penicilliopsis zonata CBS 506.65]
MGREQIVSSKSPRKDAIAYVKNNGQHTLEVDKFIEAGRPSGGDGHAAYATHYTSNGREQFAPAMKGVTGRVVETGESFYIRDDYDFANPTEEGKGYHVNVQLGKETRAYVSGRNSQAEYFDRTNMTGERVHFDGPEKAAKWYLQGHSG